MKMLDKVVLVKENKYTKTKGIKKGAIGIVVDGPRNGLWDVLFNGEKVQDTRSGLWAKIEIDVGLEEDEVKVLTEQELAELEKYGEEEFKKRYKELSKIKLEDK